jgi:hypothetical protein
MSTPEEKARLVRQQVIAKIRWGASRQEVTDWLKEKYGVVGESAEQMLTRAFEARRSAIRDAAYIRIAISFAGLALVGAFFYVRFFSGVIFYGTFAIVATVCAIAIGLTSLSVFIRNLALLLTGDAPGAVD